MQNKILFSFNYFLKFSFQLNIRATDSGIPSNYIDVQAIIQITRVRSPQFQTDTYRVNVPDSTRNGSVIETVVATHNPSIPTAQIRYEVRGTKSAPFYFALDTTTGQVTVQRNLRPGKEMEYTVS